MLRIVLAIVLFLGGVTASAAKSLVAEVDLSSQTLTVRFEGEALVTWPVSTGRAGYRTPPGTFRPQRMYREYFSRQYEGSPMPNAIFYDRGYAIHGSYELSSLGSPASHGCVRLSPENAEKLFEMVLTVGAQNTAITVRR